VTIVCPSEARRRVRKSSKVHPHRFVKSVSRRSLIRANGFEDVGPGYLMWTRDVSAARASLPVPIALYVSCDCGKPEG